MIEKIKNNSNKIPLYIVSKLADFSVFSIFFSTYDLSGCEGNSFTSLWFHQRNLLGMRGSHAKLQAAQIDVNSSENRGHSRNPNHCIQYPNAFSFPFFLNYVTCIHGNELKLHQHHWDTPRHNQITLANLFAGVRQNVFWGGSVAVILVSTAALITFRDKRTGASSSGTKDPLLEKNPMDRFSFDHR